MRTNPLRPSYLYSFLLSFVLLLSVSPLSSQSFSDCIGAIPVCDEIYEETNSPTTAGDFPNEINSALAGGGHVCCDTEDNSIWYYFTVNNTGDFGFSIIPNDLDDDYDWALFNVTDADCEDLYDNADLLVSCNAAGGAGCHGETGCTGDTAFDIQGAGCNSNPPSVLTGFSPLNALLPVQEGNTYMLYISNWTGSMMGYTLDFGLSEGIGIFDDTNPEIAEFITPDCPSGTYKIVFNEKIQCTSFGALDLVIEGPAGNYPALITGTSCDVSPYTEYIEFIIGGTLETGTYSLSLNNDINIAFLDLCANPLPTNIFEFKFEDEALDLGVDTSICQGDILLLDVGIENAIYSWQDGSEASTYEVTEGGTYIVIVDDGCSVRSDTIIVELIETGEGMISESFCEGESVIVNDIEYSETGVYEQTIEAGSDCDSLLTINITVIAHTEGQISQTILYGESVDINGEIYNTSGNYEQSLDNSNGCDSLLNIQIKVISNVVYQTLDTCEATTGTGNFSYDEFIPAYPQPLECGSVTSSILYRLNPEVNGHSCTTGLDGEATMCVSSLDGCEYENGHEKAVLMDITITPDPDYAVQLSGLSFYENAPDEFSWINGLSGTNNFPTKYGVRVLKDGLEVFKMTDISTSNGFTLQTFSFEDLVDFNVTDTTTFTFEMMAYCTVGNGALVTAWDLDEINISATCEPLPDANGKISGEVLTYTGEIVEFAEVSRSLKLSESIVVKDYSDAKGAYLFYNNPGYYSYSLDCYKNTDKMKGVTTFDLLMIQKHILNLKKFSSPYQMIAADINGTGTITALDVAMLRKLILGVLEEYPNKKSWAFMDADQELSIDNPYEYETQINIESLIGDQENMDFKAVKIGDVNGSYSPLIQASENRTADQSIFVVEDQKIQKGKTYTIEVLAEEALAVHGLDWTFNTPDLIVERLEAGVLNITEDQFYIDNQGNLKIIWTSLEGTQIKPGDILFSFIAQAEVTGTITQIFNNRYDSTSDMLFINNALEARALSIEMLSNRTKALLVLNQNQPNPFIHNTSFEFSLSEASHVEFQIVDIHGKILHESQAFYDAGAHSFTVDAETVQRTPGVHFFRIKANDEVKVKKMIYQQ